MDTPLLAAGVFIKIRGHNNRSGEETMVFWQRLLVTVIIMLVTSFVTGIIWRSLFNMVMPSYLAGIIGGLTALPVWEFLKRIKPKTDKET